ncbi:MAG: hypothetical protein EBX40_07140 [Gammaproteobacteria bacterium]|nr:hypothetical protein [Gammaproteobacteria bacterium]
MKVIIDNNEYIEVPAKNIIAEIWNNGAGFVGGNQGLLKTAITQQNKVFIEKGWMISYKTSRPNIVLATCFDLYKKAVLDHAKNALEQKGKNKKPLKPKSANKDLLSEILREIKLIKSELGIKDNA